MAIIKKPLEINVAYDCLDFIMKYRKLNCNAVGLHNQNCVMNVSGTY